MDDTDDVLGDIESLLFGLNALSPADIPASPLTLPSPQGPTEQELRQAANSIKLALPKLETGFEESEAAQLQEAIDLLISQESRLTEDGMSALRIFENRMKTVPAQLTALHEPTKLYKAHREKIQEVSKKVEAAKASIEQQKGAKLKLISQRREAVAMVERRKRELKEAEDVLSGVDEQLQITQTSYDQSSSVLKESATVLKSEKDIITDLVAKRKAAAKEEAELRSSIAVEWSTLTTALDSFISNLL